MNITEKLVIKYEVNRFQPTKPYVLFIVDYGPWGDKFNVGAGHHGKCFPVGSSERFETFDEAAIQYRKVIDYVKDKILQKRPPPKEDAKDKKVKARPSYQNWI